MNEKITKVPLSFYFLRLIPYWLPGKTRISNFIFSTFKHSGPIEFETFGLSLTAPSINETISKYIISDKIYDRQTFEVLRRCLKNDSTFLDIGANIGYFSLVASKLFCKNGAVLSIEASPSVGAFLSRNVANNSIKNIRMISKAVHTESGKEIRFFEAPTSKFGMGSLYNRPGSKEVIAETISIDDLVQKEKLNKVDLIKIDIEGYEANAFKGAKTFLSKPDAPVIVFEFNDWGETPEKIGSTPGEAQRFLRSIGFKTQEIGSWLKKPDPNQEIISKGSANIVAWKQ